jgi:hypothetical protein
MPKATEPYGNVHHNNTFVCQKPLWSVRHRPPYGNIRPGSARPLLTFPGTTHGPAFGRALAQRARSVAWARRVLADPSVGLQPAHRYKPLKPRRTSR